jgi:hypothetical protein
MAIIEGAKLRTGALSGSATGDIGPFEYAGVPAGGYLNGVAKKGAILTDTTNGILYVQTGTLASTAWTKAGVQV